MKGLFQRQRVLMGQVLGALLQWRATEVKAAPQEEQEAALEALRHAADALIVNGRKLLDELLDELGDRR